MRRVSLAWRKVYALQPEKDSGESSGEIVYLDMTGKK